MTAKPQAEEVFRVAESAAAQPGSACDAAAQGVVITPADEFLRNLRIPEPLIDGIVPRGQLYAMTGPTGHGKTALAALMQVCIATNKPFAGRQIEPGRVLVLAGENPDDFALRLLATAQSLATSPTQLHQIGVVPGSFAIGPAFDDLVAQTARFGDLAAVFVDTSAAFFDGEDENANTAMRLHASRLRRMCELPGRPAVIVLCHPTKHASKDNLQPRGGGAFLAEIDGNLTAWREGSLVTLHWAGKLRGPGFDPLTFELQPQVLAITDARGRNVASVAAAPVSPDKAEQIEQSSLSDENALLAAMLTQPRASVAELSTAAGFVYGMGLPNKARGHRVLQKLQAQGLVAQGRGGAWKLTPKGQKEAAEVLE